MSMCFKLLILSACFFISDTLLAFDWLERCEDMTSPALPLAGRELGSGSGSGANDDKCSVEGLWSRGRGPHCKSYLHQAPPNCQVGQTL